MVGCFKLGLYRQGLTHDLSKFSFDEFWSSVKYYQGNRSPLNAQREDVGYSEAWLHHKGRNKHHCEYWFDKNLSSGLYEPVPMPRKYVAESVADRIAASKVYKRDKYTDASPLEYFLAGRDTELMHDKTKDEIEYILTLLKDKGEKEVYRYVKNIYLKNNTGE